MFRCYQRKQWTVEWSSYFEPKRVGDDMVCAAVGRRGVHKDDDMSETRLIREVGRRHMRAEAMMEGAVARLQRNRDTLAPHKLRPERQQIVLIMQVLRSQVAARMKVIQPRSTGTSTSAIQAESV